jgi:hypothetical protein
MRWLAPCAAAVLAACTYDVRTLPELLARAGDEKDAAGDAHGVDPGDARAGGERNLPGDGLGPDDGIAPTDALRPGDGIGPTDAPGPDDGIGPTDALGPGDGRPGGDRSAGDPAVADPGDPRTLADGDIVPADPGCTFCADPGFDPGCPDAWNDVCYGESLGTLFVGETRTLLGNVCFADADVFEVGTLERHGLAFTVTWSPEEYAPDPSRMGLIECGTGSPLACDQQSFAPGQFFCIKDVDPGAHWFRVALQPLPSFVYVPYTLTVSLGLM